MRLGGSDRPNSFRLARTLSRDSCTAAPGRPTIVKLGRPLLMNASTRTAMASTPMMVAEVNAANISRRSYRCCL